MRPYRKVDMGRELEDHDGRLKKLERLEGQVRVFQGIGAMLLVSILGLFVQECRAVDAEEIEQAGLKQQLNAHERAPHGVDEATLESMQTLDKEHGERLHTIEERLRIRGSKKR